jgi:hypothetical protein
MNVIKMVDFSIGVFFNKLRIAAPVVRLNKVLFEVAAATSSSPTRSNYKKRAKRRKKKTSKSEPINQDKICK